MSMHTVYVLPSIKVFSSNQSKQLNLPMYCPTSILCTCVMHMIANLTVHGMYLVNH